MSLKIRLSGPKVKAVVKDCMVYETSSNTSVLRVRNPTRSSTRPPSSSSQGAAATNGPTKQVVQSCEEHRTGQGNPARHSSCLQSNLGCHRPGDRQRECWVMVDGWKGKETDGSITSGICIVQEGGEEMPQSCFLFLTMRTVGDRLSQVTGERHQGHPVTMGMTASVSTRRLVPLLRFHLLTSY